MASCQSGDVVYIGDIGKVVGFFSQGIDGILSDIAAAIMGAAVDLFSDLGNIPTIGDESINDQIHLQTDWLVATIAVASLLVAAFRMALERSGQPGVEALRGLVRLVLVVGASWVVVKWLVDEADSYTDHLYDQGIKAQLKLIADCGTDGVTAFLLIIIGLLLLIAGVVHIVLMYIRLGVMVLLTGTLPVAAAASMTQAGAGWWRKHVAWIVAWLAFKPVVGLIMYSGAVMIGSTGGNSRHFKLAGAGILLMAGIALPALMRLVVPAMAAFGFRDSTTGAVAAGAAGAGVIASGAKKIAGTGGGGGSTGGGARSAPSGSGGPAAGGGTAADTGSRAGGRGAGSLVRGGVGAAAWTLQKTAGVVASTHKHAKAVTDGALDGKPH